MARIWKDEGMIYIDEEDQRILGMVKKRNNNGITVGYDAENAAELLLGVFSTYERAKKEVEDYFGTQVRT